MRYLVWPLLFVVALVLQLLLLFTGTLRKMLRDLGGADQPNQQSYCLIQVALFPLFLPVILLHYLAEASLAWTVVIKEKLGFSTSNDRF